MIMTTSLLAGAAALLGAMTPTPTSAPTPAPAADPCASPESKQLDFWLGDWAVYAKGELAGINVITKELGGCVVHEQWTSLRGRWHQTWVDNQGSLLLLDGGWRDGRMVLEGDRPQDGKTVRDRITFEPLPESQIRQLWQTSADGGKTWAVVFDGHYVPRGSKPPPPPAAK